MFCDTNSSRKFNSQEVEFWVRLVNNWGEQSDTADKVHCARGTEWQGVAILLQNIFVNKKKFFVIKEKIPTDKNINN